MRISVGHLRRLIREALDDAPKDYKVSVTSELQGVKLRRMQQLAFIVNKRNDEITIGRSGHGHLTRGKDAHDYEGGWIFPQDGKVVMYSGLLGHVWDKTGVANALGNHIGVHLLSTRDTD
jgi:hypothetical protein